MKPKPTFHRDGTVTYWSAYCQQWRERVSHVPERELAAMRPEIRRRVIRHIHGLTAHDKGPFYLCDWCGEVYPPDVLVVVRCDGSPHLQTLCPDCRAEAARTCEEFEPLWKEDAADYAEELEV